MRMRAPLRFLLGRYLRRNRATLLSFITIPSVIFSAVAGWQTKSVGVALLIWPVALAGSALVTLIVWPFRFGTVWARHKWLPDGSVLHNYYKFRFLEANRTVTLRVEDGRLEVMGGVFTLSHLATLRIDEDINDGFPGLVDLVFDGSVVEQQRLFGWPGIPLRTALDIRDALIRQVDLEQDAG